MSRPKGKPWSPQEVEYLATWYHRRGVQVIAKALGRSVVAVKLRAKRLGYRKNGEGYTAHSLAQALGVDGHWVSDRIRDGKMHAVKRQTERLPEQGGDTWFISEGAVVAFIRKYPFDVDLRKVDQLWFMDVISTWLRAPNGKEEQNE